MAESDEGANYKRARKIGHAALVRSRDCITKIPSVTDDIYRDSSVQTIQKSNSNKNN